MKFRLHVLALFFALELLFGGCAKEHEQPAPTSAISQPVTQEEVQLLKRIFLTEKYDQQISIQATESTQGKNNWTWIPLWYEAFRISTSKTVTDIYVPMEPRLPIAPHTMVLIGAKRFLVVNQVEGKLDFSLLTFFYEESGQKTQNATRNIDYTDFFSKFSGTVLSKNLATKKEIYGSYRHGIKQYEALVSPIVVDNAGATSNRGSNCVNLWTCYWNGSCDDGGSSSGTIVFGALTSGVDGCGSSPDDRDNRCSTGGIIWTIYAHEIDVICSNPGGPGSDPGGPGSDPGGPGSDPGNPQDPTLPCPGDPMNNPAIAPSSPGNFRGGTYGDTRDGGTKFHDGIDIAAGTGTAILAVQTGVVTAVVNSFAPGQYAKRSYGNYVEIQSIVNGQVVYIKYNHLDGIGSGLTIGSPITQGATIGILGTTGNAGARGIIPHVHIQARNANRQSVDPQTFISTKFDPETGNSVRPC